MVIELNEQTLKEIQELISSDKFIQWLLSNSTQFGTAAWILQILESNYQTLIKEITSGEYN